MQSVRAILVGLIALSLAALPVGAAEMQASMAAASSHTGQASMDGHAECCPEAGHCEKQSKSDCDGSGACAVKCSILSAATLAFTNLVLPALSVDEATPVVANLSSALEHPPLPPPRL